MTTTDLPPPGGRFSPHDTRAILARLGHSPRKPLGQNFLTDGNVVDKSLQLGAIGPGDAVVEIGPGLGTLTAALLTAGATVFAVERDRVLARHLREYLGKTFAGRFFLREADAVDFPLGDLTEHREVGGDFKIVANLPYAISTPWMSAVLQGVRVPREMVVMLQREAAERFVARPDSHGSRKAIGAISIALDAAYVSVATHKVAANSFFPAPRVESVLLHLRRREHPRRLRESTLKIIRHLFLHRRKQLGGVLRHFDGRYGDVLARWQARFAEWDASPQSRPEELPFAAWHTLDDMIGETDQQAFHEDWEAGRLRPFAR